MICPMTYYKLKTMNNDKKQCKCKLSIIKKMRLIIKAIRILRC